MRIQHNIMAMSAYRNYTNNVSAMKKNLEKLSSGYKINRAGDDAAGLAISEKMRAQITGLETAQKNAKDGISLVQTAEGALTEVHDMLNRMVELATQSANGTYDNTTDRAQMQKEVNQLLSEIDRIADSSNFNGINLLDGTLGLNTDAFEIVGTTDFAAGEVVKTGATILSTTKAAPTAVADRGTNTILHKTGEAASKGEFVIDMSELTFDVKDATSLKIKVKNVEIASVALTAGDKGLKSFKDIAAKITTALSKGIYVKSDGSVIKGTNTLTGLKGALHYTASVDANTGKITFTTDKYVNAASSAAVALSNGVLVADVASGAAVVPSFNVAVSAATATKLLVGNNKGVNQQNIATTPTANPTRPATTQLASTILTLDMASIQDGTKLEFDGTTYTFAVGSNSNYKDADNVIDLTAYTNGKKNLGEVTDGNDQKKIMGIIANAMNGSKNFSVGTDENGAAAKAPWGKVTVFERGDATNSTSTSIADEATQKLLETKEGFQKLFKLTGPDTNAGTKLKITGSKINEGNTLSIGDKKYVFTTEDKKDTDDTTYVKIAKDGSDAQAQLKTALENNGVKVEEKNGDLVIYGTGKTAPAILGKGLTLQIGDTADAFNQLNVKVQDMHAKSLGLEGLKINSEELAQQATDKIKAAINMVSDVRGTLGATQNRLDHTINNLGVMTENIQDAESTIRDVDVAEEMMAYTKNNILIQSAQAMLAQANQVPQGVLQLLG